MSEERRRLLPVRLSAGLCLALAPIALSGCLEPSAEKTKPDDAQALVDSILYVKAKNGLCFGVGTTSRMSTNATVAYNNQVVLVPCADVGL